MRALTLLAFGTITLVALPGCARRASHHSPDVVVISHGPPPHAPAHGYRCKLERDVELTYDAELGVYVVLGTSHVFYHAEKQRYYRLRGSKWEVSLSLKDGWRRTSGDALPGHLALASTDKNHGHGAHKKYEVAESGK